jgi:gluconolactonase
VLADRWQGRRLNSPNDVVVARDGAVWFTDPTYGIDSDHEGHRADSEIGANQVYRLDPSGRLDAVADDFVQPNGLAFSPDERRLYIVDTGWSHVEDGPRHVRAFEVGESGRLSGGAVFAKCAAGSFDGLRVDREGRLWCGTDEGVHCYAPDGTLIGKVHVPERVANVAFGGADGTRLFMTATTSLYAIDLLVRGD